MTSPVVFLRAARQEFDEAADWYESRLRGLGTTFTSAVDHALERIVDRPDFYPAVWNDVREALVARFPYCVYYRASPERILVVAIFHTARDPSAWRGRTF